MVDARMPVALGGIITNGRSTLHIFANGKRRKGGTDPVTMTDLWHFGSNAKAMVAALYGRLVEAGLFTWDERVHELFPESVVHQSWQRITVLELLSHTSGVVDRDLLGAWTLIKSELDERPLPQQRLSLAEKAFAAARLGDSGKFAYANANYVILAAAMELRTQTAFEELIKQHIFDALDMASAGFGAPVGNQPWGHRRGLVTLGRLKAVAPGPAADNPPFMRPAGGIHLSLEDYAKFLRLFLCPQDGFLSRQTLEKLTTVTEASPAYALGWLVEDIPWAGGRALGHEGSNTMWYATAIVAPANGLAAAAVSNEGGKQAAAATREVVRKLFGKWS
jgi:CubicO group peptidase (beta-lactamase class C family)